VKPSRYTLIEVKNCGHRVAVIEDTRTGEIHKIRRKGGSFFYWDRNDGPVKRNPELVQVAKEALEKERAS
jgi:hypothetical protein